MISALMLNVFLVGLASSLHCSSMCGGIMGALGLSLPARVKDSPVRFGSFIFLYNLGRLGSYVALGALAGGLGGGLWQSVPASVAPLLFKASAAVIFVAVGLHLTGLLPRLSVIESLGAPVWRRLEPLGRRLLPVTRPWQALVFGAVWGWMPCGLVYAMLLLALASGQMATGAAVMLAFGLGSMPSLFAAGMLTRLLARLVRVPRLRVGLGAGLIALGIVSGFAPVPAIDTECRVASEPPPGLMLSFVPDLCGDHQR